DFDAALCKIDGVLEQIAEPIEDRRVARAKGLLLGLLRQRNVDGNAEMAMRRDNLLKQRADRQTSERLAVGGKLGELREYFATTLRLLAQEPHVIGMRRVRRNGALEFARNDGNRRQRRAKFVRGGSSQPVELRQMLLAFQHQFGRCKGFGELAALFSDLPRIDADEDDREENREPNCERVDEWQFDRLFAFPRQRVVDEQKHRREQHRETAKHQGETRGQRGCAEQDGRDEEECERILQAASEKKQRGNLGGVKRKQPGSAVGL